MIMVVAVLMMAVAVAVMVVVAIAVVVVEAVVLVLAAQWRADSRAVNHNVCAFSAGLHVRKRERVSVERGREVE